MFEVLGEAAVAAEPCERSFQDPAAGQDLEALGGIGSLDALAVDDGCARTGFALRAASPRAGQALGIDPQPGVAAFMR